MTSHADIDIFEVSELTTPTYRATLIDNNGDVVQGAVLDTLTLTVFQEYTLEIVNGRYFQDVLNTNGVIVDTNGLLVWSLTTLDTVILNPALRKEMHRARFAWTFDSGLRAGTREVIIMVNNSARLPT